MLPLTTKSVVSAVLIQPGVWLALARRYPNDSLYTLSNPEIAGLIFLSSLMALSLFTINVCKSRALYRLLTKINPQFCSRGRWILLDMATTIVLCLIALWLAPQIHYTYYQLIIDSLPMQWVVGGALDARQLLNFVILRPDGSIAEHATGIVIWACVLSSLIRHKEDGV